VYEHGRLRFTYLFIDLVFGSSAGGLRELGAGGPRPVGGGAHGAPDAAGDLQRVLRPLRRGVLRLQAAGESARLVVESPWLQFTSECQRFGHPPRRNNSPFWTQLAKIQAEFGAGIAQLRQQLEALLPTQTRLATLEAAQDQETHELRAGFFRETHGLREGMYPPR
jgi:hypothetical protein